MFKDQIYNKGLHKAPDDREIDVLLYAAQNIEKEEEQEIEDYLSWLPIMGDLFLLRDYLQGYRLKWRPLVKI